MVAAITAFIREVFFRFWTALQTFFLDVLKWILTLINDFCVFCINTVFGVLKWLVSLLPVAPKFPSTGPIPELFGTANYYFPVSEAITLFALWGAVYAVVSAIKFVKFLRGGG